MSVKKFGRKWISRPDGYSVAFNKCSLKKAMKYVLGIYFFNFVSTLLQGNCLPLELYQAPFIANIFYFYYENKWKQKTKRRNLIQSRKCSNMFQFIDNLPAINDSGEFENVYHEIYPTELQLKRENCSNKETSFLDHDIAIANKKFPLSLYDKRDSFLFSIIRMSYLSINKYALKEILCFTWD